MANHDYLQVMSSSASFVTKIAWILSAFLTPFQTSSPFSFSSVLDPNTGLHFFLVLIPVLP